MLLGPQASRGDPTFASPDTRRGSRFGASLPSAVSAPSQAITEPGIEITVGDKTLRFSRSQLLGSRRRAEYPCRGDVAYRRQMAYEAVPLALPLKGLEFPADTVIEAVATDGLCRAASGRPCGEQRSEGAVAWVAVEPADAPWPAPCWARP